MIKTMATKNLTDECGIGLIELKKKNYCFILCNSEFERGQDLLGYSADVRKIRETFDGLNFHLSYEENKTAEGMLEVLTGWASTDFSDAEIIVLFILSHGYEHGEIFGTDKKTINIRDVKSIFSRQRLVQIPKLIFLHACRGELAPPEVVKTESFVFAGPKSRGTYRDILVYYSTMEGYAALVDPTEGTSFIRYICDTLQRGQISVSKLITAVNCSVSSTPLECNQRTVAQVPQAVSTLRRDITFPDYQSANLEGATIRPYEINGKNPCMFLVNDEYNESLSNMFSAYHADIEDAFSSLNFQVNKIENLDSEKIKEEKKKWTKSDYSNNDCFACVILSLGGMENDNNDEVMYGINGTYVPIETLVSSVSTNTTLYGKPKLFFMVLRKCSKKLIKGEADNTEEHTFAGAGDKIIKAKFADTFVFFVMVDTDDATSFFIKTLSEIMVEFAKQGYHNMEDMILRTNDKLAADKSKDVIAEARSTLTYEVYFKNNNSVHPVQATDAEPNVPYVIGGVTSMDLSEQQSKFALQCNPVRTSQQNSMLPPKGVPTVHQFGTTNVLYPASRPVAKTTEIKGRGRARGRGRGMLGSPRPGMMTTPVPTTPLTPTHTPTPTPVPTIQHLKYNHIEELKNYLDPDNVCNWKHLGHEIFRGDKEMTSKVDHLKRQVYGGSRPGLSLLEFLETKGIKVKELLDVAKEFSRMDIVETIEDSFEDSDTLLENLDIITYTKLSEKLDKTVRGAKNWQDFADKFGCTEDQIHSFDEKKENCSPTKSLIKLIKTSKVDYKLSELQSKLRDIHRNDVAKYLDEVIKELS